MSYSAEQLLASTGTPEPESVEVTYILLTPDLMQLLMGTSISCMLEPAAV